MERSEAEFFSPEEIVPSSEAVSSFGNKQVGGVVSNRERGYQLPEDVALDLENSQPEKGWMEYWKARFVNDPEANKLGWHGQAKISEGLGNQLHRLVLQRVETAQIMRRRLEVMRKLARRLTDIDKRVDYSEKDKGNRRLVSYDTETGELYVRTKSGKKHTLALHDIVADLDWGVRYRPDESIPQELWRSLRKRSDVAEARWAIERIYNEELAEQEGLTLPTTSLTADYIEGSFRNGKNKGLHGVISERMAKNLLSREGLKDKNTGIRVENVNAFEDSELKYDFKVIIDVDRKRGVAIEPEGLSRDEYVKEKRAIGVQFTVGPGYGKLKQIAKAKRHLSDERVQELVKHSVEDIVLVKLNLNASERYRRWLDDGKPPGGPEQYITNEEKESLLQSVYVGLEKRISFESEAASKTPAVPASPKEETRTHQEQAIINLRRQLGLSNEK